MQEQVFCIIPGMDKCLYIFTQERFGELTKEFGFGLFLSRKRRETFRKLFGGMGERKCDGHGRIQIPDELMEFAGLKDEVVFVGFNDRIEVWDLKIFEESGQIGLQDFGKLAEELVEGEKKGGGSSQSSSSERGGEPCR